MLFLELFQQWLNNSPLVASCEIFVSFSPHFHILQLHSERDYRFSIIMCWTVKFFLSVIATLPVFAWPANNLDSALDTNNLTMLLSKCIHYPFSSLPPHSIFTFLACSAWLYVFSFARLITRNEFRPKQIPCLWYTYYIQLWYFCNIYPPPHLSPRKDSFKFTLSPLYWDNFFYVNEEISLLVVFTVPHFWDRLTSIIYHFSNFQLAGVTDYKSFCAAFDCSARL